jgi:hypothetical protein
MNLFFIKELGYREYLFIIRANYLRCAKYQNKPLGQGLKEKRLLYKEQ